VVVIADAVGEEEAVDLIRFGAQDLVLRDHLDRLGLVVRREIADTVVRRERTAARLALAASEARYRMLFDLHPQPMWVYDTETLRFLEVNAAAIADYGYSRDEFVAMTLADIRPPEDVPALLENVRAQRPGRSRSGPWRHVRRDGSMIDVEIASEDIDYAGRPARLVAVTDVTERRRLEAQLRQAQKMEAIGRLAGGIAHDFNNLLTAIDGYAELAASALPDDHPARADILEIRRAGQRAARLTSQLLAFGRRQVLSPTVVEPDRLIDDLGVLLRRIIGEDIALELDLGAAGVAVLVDGSQLEQVIMNLAVNARDAMPDGGRLTIGTRVVAAEPAVQPPPNQAAPPSGEPASGRWLEITVADTGIGMDEATLGQIFEPFFTTKPAGEGTGLGLSTVYGIVTQSGGQISVTSRPSAGSTFRVRLPVVDGDQVRNGPPTVVEPPAVGAEPPIGGSETILLVEDEPGIRSLMAQSLRRLGYEVLEAGDAATARRLAAERRIDLLLSDVVMPGADGPALAEALLAAQPDLRILFVSGYAPGLVPGRPAVEGRYDFLPKPFDAATLAARVREVLDAPPRREPGGASGRR
ncbi:MAG TPA: ATP-binding protein, partial [Candidatus Binatia bacterium]|nr:ATP-binding protein [Candidatus Binatia bacterium]